VEIFAIQGASPVSTTPAANFATGTTGVVDTGVKIATSINATPVQTMGTISGCRHLKVNLDGKNLYIC
jgi:hypothetical protein